jgi:hypothetical protein
MFWTCHWDVMLGLGGAGCHVELLEEFNQL